MPSRERLAFLRAVSRLSTFSKKAARIGRAARPNSTRIRSLARRVDLAQRHLESIPLKSGSPSFPVQRSAERLLGDLVAMLTALARPGRGRGAKFQKR